VDEPTEALFGGVLTPCAALGWIAWATVIPDCDRRSSSEPVNSFVLDLWMAMICPSLASEVVVLLFPKILKRFPPRP
jgi:hypothetical protein